MNLGSRYKIESDDMNVTLLERHVAKAEHRLTKVAGRESWIAIRYYGNLENLLNGVVDIEIGKTGMATLAEVVAVVKNLKADIHQMLAENISRTYEKGPEASGVVDSTPEKECQER